MERLFGAQVIGISGRMGSGKNYVAERLLLPMLPPLPTMVVALADHFKVDVVAKDRFPYEKVFVQKDQETRRALQHRGTEEGRDRYGDDIWVRTLETWMRIHAERGIRRFIICDVRFPNELIWIRSLGGVVIRVIAPTRTMLRVRSEARSEEAFTAIMNHPSESSMDVVPLEHYDAVIYNDEGQQLIVLNAVRDLVVRLTPKQEVVIFCDLDDTICICQQHYSKITEQVMNHFGIVGDTKIRVVDEHVNSFATRYFRKSGFADSLIAAVEDALKGELAAIEKQWVMTMGQSVFDRPYDLIDPRIPDVLRRISKSGRLIIFTLGDRLEQMRKVAYLSLPYPVEVFHHKDANMFRHLMAAYPAEQHIMIGDSRSRDILPAIEAGLNLVIHIGSSDFPVLDESVAQYIEACLGMD